MIIYTFEDYLDACERGEGKGGGEINKIRNTGEGGRERKNFFDIYWIII